MLRQFQRHFMTMICVPATSAMRIYRNNYTTRLFNSLQQTYPVIERLVGAAFFKRLARDFIAQEPSFNADLNRYGKGFADFVRIYPAVQGLSYLADVAALEWLIHESSCAPDRDADTLSALLAAAGDYGSARVMLHPALRLHDSKYPIHSIWLSNQPGAPERTIPLAGAHTYLMICRQQHQIMLSSLDEASYVAMHVLARGYDLESAVDAASTIAADFDIRGFLKRLLAPGVACGIHAGSS